MLVYGTAVNLGTGFLNNWNLINMSITASVVILICIAHCIYEVKAQRIIDSQINIINDLGWTMRHLSVLGPTLVGRHKELMKDGQIDLVLDETRKFDALMRRG